MNAVLDPGCLVSAVITPQGVCARLVRAWKLGAFQMVCCPRLLEELSGVLHRPRFSHLPRPAIARLVGELHRETVMHADAVTVRRWTRDPNDDYLVELAIASRSIIVSGDHDLLHAKLPVPTLSPRPFLERIESSEPGRFVRDA